MSKTNKAQSKYVISAHSASEQTLTRFLPASTRAGHTSRRIRDAKCVHRRRVAILVTIATLLAMIVLGLITYKVAQACRAKKLKKSTPKILTESEDKDIRGGSEHGSPKIGTVGTVADEPGVSGEKSEDPLKPNSVTEECEEKTNVESSYLDMPRKLLSKLRPYGKNIGYAAGAMVGAALVYHYILKPVNSCGWLSTGPVRKPVPDPDPILDTYTDDEIIDIDDECNEGINMGTDKLMYYQYGLEKVHRQKRDDGESAPHNITNMKAQVLIGEIWPIGKDYADWEWPTQHPVGNFVGGSRTHKRKAQKFRDYWSGRKHSIMSSRDTVLNYLPHYTWADFEDAAFTTRFGWVRFGGTYTLTRYFGDWLWGAFHFSGRWPEPEELKTAIHGLARMHGWPTDLRVYNNGTNMNRAQCPKEGKCVQKYKHTRTTARNLPCYNWDGPLATFEMYYLPRPKKHPTKRWRVNGTLVDRPPF